MNARRGRIYVLTIWSLSGLLVSASATLLIVMLANVIGPFRFVAMNAEEASRALGFWLPVDDVRPLPPEMARRTEAWRALVERDATVIESANLRDLLNLGVGAVIMPDARQLEPEQAQALLRYMDLGGGIVVTGSFGVRGEDQTWRGYDIMREILRVRSVTPLDVEYSNALSAHRRGPISVQLGPMQRFAILSEPGVPAISVDDSELRWTLAESAGLESVGASRRVRLGRGRLAWIAVGPEIVIGNSDESRVALERVMRNALAWVRRRPLVEVLPWPGGAPFAVTLTQGTRSQPGDETPAGRVRIGEALVASLDVAAQTGEYLQLEIPKQGRGDLWAENLRIRLNAGLTARGAWFAPRAEVLRWSERLPDIRFSVTEAGPNRLLVDVTHIGTSEQPIENAALRIWLNRPAGMVRLEQTTIGQSPPRLRFDRAQEAVDVIMPELGSGQTQSFYVDIDNPSYSDITEIASH